MRLAPIGIPVYSRLDHLRQTISALQANDLVSDSELYLFSDGPRPGDEDKVDAVRKYMRTIKGFKSVHIIERGDNNFLLNTNGNIRSLLDEYSRMILVEEDVVTAPGFLRFMNEALDFYGHDGRIFAICGYTPPISFPESYKKDVYLSPRFSAWGAGYWADRYEQIQQVITPVMYQALIDDCDNGKLVCLGGQDILGMLKLESEGKLNAVDIRIFYTQITESKFTLHPTYSMTHNIGMDGTGLHCSASNAFDVDLALAPKKLTLDSDLKMDEAIIRRLLRYNYIRCNSLPKRMMMKILPTPIVQSLADKLRGRSKD